MVIYRHYLKGTQCHKHNTSRGICQEEDRRSWNRVGRGIGGPQQDEPRPHPHILHGGLSDATATMHIVMKTAPIWRLAHATRYLSVVLSTYMLNLMTMRKSSPLPRQGNRWIRMSVRPGINYDWLESPNMHNDGGPSISQG